MRSLTTYLLASIAYACVLAPVLAQDRGPPWRHYSIDDSDRGADGVRLADANGDGLLDIATGWEEAGLIRVYLNPGPAKAKQAWPKVTVGRVKSPEDAVLIDVDGDGALDVVSCCEGNTRSVFVHWAPRVAGTGAPTPWVGVPSAQDNASSANKASPTNDGTRSVPTTLLDESAWTTAALPALAGGQLAMYCLPLQIDGQRGIDLVIGSKGAGAKIGWLQSPANPRDLAAWTYHPLCDAGWIMTLAADDLDGDGDQDILASDRKGKNAGCLWLENPGAAPAQTQPWTRRALGAAGSEVMFLHHADYDGDGLRDLLVPTYGKQLFLHRRLAGQPVAFESLELSYPAAIGKGKGIRAADMDRDRKLDLVISTENYEGTSGLVWIRGRDQSPREISGPAGARGMKLDDIQLLDLDADGDLDVLTTEERTGWGVVWFENPTR